MAMKKRLGELLYETGLVTQEELDKALKLQVGGTRRLGYLLIKMGIISEQQLQSTLSEQLGLPIISPEDKFDPKVRKILPRYLCRKYNVLPLALGTHNVLEIAMADPSDSGAIEDIEQYTGKVLRPHLAAHSDIEAAITKYIPWSFRDIFNPLNQGRITAVTAAVALALAAMIIIQYSRDRIEDLYGSRQVTADAVFYQNNELMLTFEHSGKVSLQGHGAHSQGSYSITFDDIDAFNTFIRRKEDQFSTRQKTWLDWAVANHAGR